MTVYHGIESDGIDLWRSDASVRTGYEIHTAKCIIENAIAVHDQAIRIGRPIHLNGVKIIMCDHIIDKAVAARSPSENSIDPHAMLTIVHRGYAIDANADLVIHDLIIIRIAPIRKYPDAVGIISGNHIVSDGVVTGILQMHASKPIAQIAVARNINTNKIIQDRIGIGMKFNTAIPVSGNNITTCRSTVTDQIAVGTHIEPETGAIGDRRSSGCVRSDLVAEQFYILGIIGKSGISKTDRLSAFSAPTRNQIVLYFQPVAILDINTREMTGISQSRRSGCIRSDLVVDNFGRIKIVGASVKIYSITTRRDDVAPYFVLSSARRSRDVDIVDVAVERSPVGTDIIVEYFCPVCRIGNRQGRFRALHKTNDG